MGEVGCHVRSLNLSKQILDVSERVGVGRGGTESKLAEGAAEVRDGSEGRRRNS